MRTSTGLDQRRRLRLGEWIDPRRGHVPRAHPLGIIGLVARHMHSGCPATRRTDENALLEQRQEYVLSIFTGIACGQSPRVRRSLCTKEISHFRSVDHDGIKRLALEDRGPQDSYQLRLSLLGQPDQRQRLGPDAAQVVVCQDHDVDVGRAAGSKFAD